MRAAKLETRENLTTEEYLARERAANERHEFLDGETYQIAGESVSHSTIRQNISGEFYNQLKGKKCRAFSPNMKVRSGHYFPQKKHAKGLFSYPDLTIVCGEPEFLDENKDVLLNPKVIFEVLSPSTEAFDRGEKFSRYRAWNETLTDYVLLWQNAPVAEHYERQENNRWLLTIIENTDGELTLESVECVLKLSDVYDRIEFEESE